MAALSLHLYLQRLSSLPINRSPEICRSASATFVILVESHVFNDNYGWFQKDAVAAWYFSIYREINSYRLRGFNTPAITAERGRTAVG